MRNRNRQVKPVTDEVRQMVTRLRESVEELADFDFHKFEPISYKTQVVNGTNYFIKVKVGNNKYIHVRVYKPLGNRPASVVKISPNQTLDSEITYF